MNGTCTPGAFPPVFFTDFCSRCMKGNRVELILAQFFQVNPLFNHTRRRIASESWFSFLNQAPDLSRGWQYNAAVRIHLLKFSFDAMLIDSNFHATRVRISSNMESFPLESPAGTISIVSAASSAAIISETPWGETIWLLQMQSKQFPLPGEKVKWETS